MLTSSNPNNQYLRPEYLSPLPTTMDSKQSPLALLAQTCSAIGADSPNPKLLANIEKSTKSSSNGSLNNHNHNNNNNNNNNSLTNHHHMHSMHNNSKFLDNRDKLSPSGSHSSNSSSSDIPKSSFKPYESVSSSSHHRDKTTTPDSMHNHRIKTPKSSSSQSSAMSMMMNGNHPASHQMLNGRCGSNQSASSPRASPASNNHSNSSNNNNNNNIRKTPSSISMTPDKSASPHSASLNLTKEQSPSSTPLESPISLVSSNNKHSIESLSNKETSKSQSSSTSSSSSSTSSTSNTMPSMSTSYLGYPGGLPYPMDLMTSALMSPHHQMLKAAALNPYLNYSRMKVPGGNESLMPVCRDPYCTGCALSPHMMGAGKPGSTCPAGCTQCDHPANKAYSQLSNAHNNAAAAAFAHAQLAAYAAATQLPYVCSWVAGDTPYCGKRFGSPEELLQHLRSHTSSMSESMLNPAAAAAVAGLPPNHPLFSRSYPTPPLSPLSTARYHPYSKPSMMSPSMAQSSLAGLPMPPHPSLAQYFSPYSLYGPRLGTPPSMHP